MSGVVPTVVRSELEQTALAKPFHRGAEVFCAHTLNRARGALPAVFLRISARIFRIGARWRCGEMPHASASARRQHALNAAEKSVGAFYAGLTRPEAASWLRVRLARVSAIRGADA